MPALEVTRLLPLEKCRVCSSRTKYVMAASRIAALTALVLHLAFLSNSADARGGGGATPTPAPPSQNTPPAPSLVAPADATSLAQPVALSWNSVSAAGGPIGSYTWQVSNSSGFTTIMASGFTNMDSDSSVPTPTSDRVSGLPNGTYFWRVKATQLSGGATGSTDSPWSAVRSFTVTGIGSAPATPSITAPANGAQFHIRENYNVQWSSVPGAHYYVLEVANEPTFSFPLALTQAPLTFGTQFRDGWGNAISNIYYRVRAVSVDGVRSLPSATVVVHVTNAAPVPAAISAVSPVNGASVSPPFFFDWADTPNPQIPAYDLEVSSSSTFAPGTDALLLQGVTRSDYMITSDVLVPGNYFWRVRALHGDVAGPWSTPRSVTVNAGPAVSPNVGLFAIVAEPVNGYGGNSTQARVILDNPAPAGGAAITLATDLPQAQLPFTTVTVPAGRTDAVVSPISTGPVPSNGLSVGIIGDVFAAWAGPRQQNSLGVLPILFGLNLSNQYVIGGTSVTGVVTLQSAAPPGGVTVRLVSSNLNLVNPPATVFIPGGATDSTFSIPTSPVSVPTRVSIDTGTDTDGYRAPQVSVVVTPAGSAAPPASLSSLTLSAPSVSSGSTVAGTVTLTAPAPAGGAVVSLSASLEGQVMAPASVTVPGGSLSASFSTTPAPEVVFPHWVMVQAHYGSGGSSQARVLEIDPAGGPATLLGIGPAGQDVIGGQSGRGSVALVMPAPAGGATVSLTTDNPSIIQVPASVSIPEGNSAVSFAINTTPVSTNPAGGNVTASAGGVTKSIFVTVRPDPNAPPILQGVSVNPTSVTGGSNVTGAIQLNSPAPSGGIEATISTSNTVVKPPPVVTVPAGQTSVNFTITTSSVTSNTPVTITAIVGNTSKSASLTVTQGGAPAPTAAPTATPAASLNAPSQLTPAADARFAPGTNLTFDWTDVTGAANYTIQISDQSSFPSAIANQTVTGSQFSTSTLPVKTMWWRVRANEASGKAGLWSAASRFEVKS